jgi:hypothetical protein
VYAKTPSGVADGRWSGRSEYRVILVADIEEYGAPYRNDPIRVRLHADLRELLTAALSGIGIDTAQYTMDSTGDGWLLTIDPAVGKPRLLGPVMDLLTDSLRERNGRTDLAGRLRVRLVLHAGDMLVADGYLVGGQVIFAFRLLDAEQLRVLLKQTSGPLLVCVSDAVYQQVIAQRHEGLDPAAYEPVRLEHKNVHGLGWVRAPDEPGLAARAGFLARDAVMG